MEERGLLRLELSFVELASGISGARGREHVVWFEFRYQFTDTCVGNFSVVLPVDLGDWRGSEHYL